MNKKLPFGLTTRKQSPYYYVRFRNEETGKFMSWVSTKETNYSRALRKAWDLYNEAAASQALHKLSFYDSIRKSDYTKEDVEKFLDDFRRKGFLTSYVMNDSSTENLPAMQFFLDFWNPEKSEYIREKKRKGQTIHKKHENASLSYLNNYWKTILADKKLGELTRADISAQFAILDNLSVSGNTKNHILRSVLTPLRWAYNNELVSRDITRGWTMYRMESKERMILTRAMAEKVFKVEWDSEAAKTAAMLSMCSGMRLGEIVALTLEDVEDYRIHVNHSWNEADGLKCTKNRECRTVFLPFPSIIEKLIKMGKSNPYDKGYGFIFWGKTPDKPLDHKIFLKFFRRALERAGLTHDAAEKYTFHSWRHFYTTYMADRINSRILQSQTGHKTQAMLDHYANHQTDEDSKLIMDAQRVAFGGLLE